MRRMNDTDIGVDGEEEIDDVGRLAIFSGVREGKSTSCDIGY